MPQSLSAMYHKISSLATGTADWPCDVLYQFTCSQQLHNCMKNTI